nr:cytidine deaminase [Fournierella massiliensis]
MPAHHFRQLCEQRGHHCRGAPAQLHQHDEDRTGRGGVRMEKAELARLAIQAREMAYTPYSHFNVGAALLAKDGRVFTGCNIENAAYTPSNCAERTALFKAVSEGAREFSVLAVVGAPAGQQPPFPVTGPCGVCRQALNEFCELEMPVLLVTGPDSWTEVTLGELLPYNFGPRDLA